MLWISSSARAPAPGRCASTCRRSPWSERDPGRRLAPPLRDRFGVICRLEFYKPEDLVLIIKRTADILDMAIDDDGALEIARRSRGTPRIANRLLKRVRDFAQVAEAGTITASLANDALNRLEVDSCRPRPDGPPGPAGHHR